MSEAPETSDTGVAAISVILVILLGLVFHFSVLEPMEDAEEKRFACQVEIGIQIMNEEIGYVDADSIWKICWARVDAEGEK